MPSPHLFHSERPSKSSFVSLWWDELLDNSRTSWSLFVFTGTVIKHWNRICSLGAKREKFTENFFPIHSMHSGDSLFFRQTPPTAKHKTFFNQFIFRNATEFDDRWTHSVNTNQEIEANTFIHQRQSQDRFHSGTSALRAATTIDSQVSNSEERRSPWQIPLNTLLSSISSSKVVRWEREREKLFFIGRRRQPTTNRTEKWHPCWKQ